MCLALFFFDSALPIYLEATYVHSDVPLILIVSTSGKNCSAAAAIVALCLTFAAVHAAVLGAV